MEELFKLLEKLAERTQAEAQFKPEDVEGILKDPSITLRLAVASASGAQNRIALSGGQPTRSQVEDASLCQAQSALWMEIHARQLEVEDRAADERRREETERQMEEIRKQQEDRERFPKPTYGSRVSDAFRQQGNRPGSAKVPPFDLKPEPIIPFTEQDVPDASSGNEDKPVT